MPNLSLYKKSSGTNWPIAGGEDKGVNILPMGISPKVNVIVWREFELTYFDVAVQHFSPCDTETVPHFLNEKNFFLTKHRIHQTWLCATFYVSEIHYKSNV